MTRQLSLAAAAGALALAVSAPASAMVVTYQTHLSGSFSGSAATDNDGGDSPFSHDVGLSGTLARFDPSLGSLNSVALHLGAATDPYHVNLGASSTDDATRANLLDADGRYAVALLGVVAGVPGGPVNASDHGFASCSAIGLGNLHCSASIAGSASASGDFNFFDPASFALYSGTSPFDLAFTLRLWLRANVDDGDAFAASAMSLSGGHWSADASVSYDYTPGNGSIAPVPEPASWALVLAGLGALGVAGRRRTGRPAPK